MSAVNRVYTNASSLIENVDTNVVESFNSVVAKLVSGKRINYSQRSSYIARCNAAVVSFNSKGEFHRKMQQKLSQTGPSKCVERYCKRKAASIQRPQRKFAKKIKRFNKMDVEEKNYGPQANTPFIEDMATDMYEKKKEEFFKALKTDNPETIQNLTVGQHSNDYWKFHFWQHPQIELLSMKMAVWK
ncbi:hypothetical protein QE152_g6107 [Popillia japonica]|uniref:Uncharacterized protein n=1 Tax=Popillia japonica TaxID=7064 RepID=A0AAW1MK36_POPJA